MPPLTSRKEGAVFLGIITVITMIAEKKRPSFLKGRGGIGGGRGVTLDVDGKNTKKAGALGRISME